MLSSVLNVKALVGAFNQKKALVGAFSVIVQPVVEPMEHYTELVSAVAEYAPDSPQLLRNLLMLINIIITPSHTRNFKYLNTEF